MNLRERFDALDLETIDEFLADQREEDLHLDFKTADPGFGNRDDRRHLAIGISGFANSEGGLIVWGVDARPNAQGVDGASERKEIVSLGLFISKVNQYSGDAASPIVDGVQHKKIVVNGDRGYAVTLVPESHAGPHMAKLGEDRYYKRSGSQFLKMEHFEVADMFGRRRRPLLRLKFHPAITSRRGNGDLQYNIILCIENYGRASAIAPFLEVRIDPPYIISEWGVDGNRNYGLPIVRGPGSRANMRFGGRADVVLHPGVCHDVVAIGGDLLRDQNTLSDLRISYSVAAADVPIQSDVLHIGGAALVAAIRDA